MSLKCILERIFFGGRVKIPKSYLEKSLNVRIAKNL
jgi:hypothetical protein